MICEEALPEIEERDRDTDRAIERAFVTVHLLTADAGQAENAVLDAIEEWDPDYEPEEALFDRALTSALQNEHRDAFSSPGRSGSNGTIVPEELQAVLGLPAQLRRCFVLRILAGLSRRDCADRLNLTDHSVDTYTCAALTFLPRMRPVNVL